MAGLRRNHTQPGVKPLFEEEFELPLPAFIVVVVTTSVVVVFFVIYCTWKCWKIKHEHSSLASTPEEKLMPSNFSSNLKISQSTPDIMDEMKQDHFTEQKIGKSYSKTVLRQTTLPTVPQRHQSFQRQLSHKLDLTNVEFTIQSLKYKEQPSVGNIKPELYKRTPSQDCPVTKSVGQLYFSLMYSTELEALLVTVDKAEDLPAKDFSGTSDPYVKLYLLPDRKKKFQTKVHRKTLNPMFEENFMFTVPHHELSDRTLQFSIYDFDRFSRHDLIGVVLVKDVQSQIDVKKETLFVKDIICTNQEKIDLGELMLSLCYLPTAGRLTVTIIKARNLKAMDVTGSSDPYVKVCLMCQGKRIKKKKTSVKKCTLNPVYNEAIVFDVPQENVEEISIIIKVIDYDRVGSNEIMGCCAVGPRYIGPGRDHWFEMLENPRKPIAQWYSLNEHVPGASNDPTPNGKSTSPNNQQGADEQQAAK